MLPTPMWDWTIKQVPIHHKRERWRRGCIKMDRVGLRIVITLQYGEQTTTFHCLLKWHINHLDDILALICILLASWVSGQVRQILISILWQELALFMPLSCSCYHRCQGGQSHLVPFLVLIPTFITIIWYSIGVLMAHISCESWW